MAYQYESLPMIEEDSDDIYIRLVRLPPAPKTKSITCSIFTTRLSEAPEFEAVSYCWGAAHGGTIFVTTEDESQPSSPGAALGVPGSIIPFLFRTRDHRIPRQRTLWIDSICINQKDSDEKTIQVPKMREIYQKAEATISWLGPEQGRSNDGFEYANGLNILYWQHMAKLGLWTLPEEGLRKTFDMEVKLGDPGLEAIFELLQRPYFERAWIVQEVIVSNRVWLVCGDAVVSWQVLFAGLLYLVHVTPWVWEFYPSQRYHFLFMLRCSQADWEEGRKVDWWRVLLRHRICIATDPRDKVYAYYGLGCKHGLQELRIKPNYSNTIMENLFINLAVNALMMGQSEVLHVSRLVTGIEQEKDPDFTKAALPSWVPDWRWTQRTPHSLIGGEGIVGGAYSNPSFHASNNSIFKVGFDTSPNSTQQPAALSTKTLPKMIMLNGFTVARVTLLTAAWSLQAPTGRQTLFEQTRILQENQLQISDWETVLRPSDISQVYFPTKESQISAFYETLMAGTSIYSQAQKQAAAAGFERRQRILRLIPTFNLHKTLIVYGLVILLERFLRLFNYKNPETIFRTMVGHTVNRKGARLTSNDSIRAEYLGLVPGLCKLGDYIVLVEGIKTPLVLRPKDKTTMHINGVQGHSKTVHTWELIGDCYIHGIMKGEAWKNRAHKCRELWIA